MVERTDAPNYCFRVVIKSIWIHGINTKSAVCIAVLIWESIFHGEVKTEEFLHVCFLFLMPSFVIFYPSGIKSRFEYWIFPHISIFIFKCSIVTLLVGFIMNSSLHPPTGLMRVWSFMFSRTKFLHYLFLTAPLNLWGFQRNAVCPVIRFHRS